MTSRAELVTFFAPNGFRRKLAEKSISDERFLIASSSLINVNGLENLSEAEREIVGLMIAGSTNAHIAERREASEYTVANQVQSIFRKLSVRSRAELVAKLQKLKERYY
jgi:DNA-binding NarL/FixJ family response regulator